MVLSVNFQLPNEDPEIFDISSKCLSILVQLYGGENPDSLSPENVEIFAHLLTSKEDPKEQKLLLRILRRMVSLHRNWGHWVALLAATRAVNSHFLFLISDFQKICKSGEELRSPFFLITCC